MKTQLERARRERVGEVIERVRGIVSKEEPGREDEAERFAHHFYRHVSPVDLQRETDENLAGAAVSVWGYAHHREPDAPKVRIFNPDREKRGWESPHTVIEIVNDDMPFLVDSVTGLLTDLGLEVLLVIHPIVRVERDAAGDLQGWSVAAEELPGGVAESFMHLQVATVDVERHEELKKAIAGVLNDVRTSVVDYDAMRDRVRELLEELRDNPPPIKTDEAQEAIALLRWMDHDHFTFLGYREYRFEGHGEDARARILRGTTLGVMRDLERHVFAGLRNMGSLPAEVRHFLREPVLIHATKSNLISPVHRRIPLDTVSVKAFDDDGHVIGQRIFVGLWTSSAYAASVYEVPFVRHRVRRVLERSGLALSSHDGRVLSHVLESYPRDELVQTPEDELLGIALGILNLQERKRIALFTRRDPFERFVSCIVYAPRDNYDTALRLKFQGILTDAFNGTVERYYTHISDGALARVRFIVKTTPGEVPDVDLVELEQNLIEAGRLWEDRVTEALVGKLGQAEGRRWAARWAAGFPSNYREDFDANIAAADAELLENAYATGTVAMNLYRPSGSRGPYIFHFKIYYADRSVPLSTILPMLENMGVQVRGEIPYAVHIAERQRPLWIRNFVLQASDRRVIDLDEVRESFHEVFDLVWCHEMENDGFNRLVLDAGLAAREVIVLRNYCRFMLQARLPFSQAYMEETLCCNPDLARKLVELFLVRFDPALPEHPGDASRGENIAASIREGLEDVSNLDEDRIIRHFLNVIESTMRTNFFQTDAEGNPKRYLSFKIDSGKVEGLPRPVPFCEIFVASARMEGIHLRGGPVARGGIRWSDRREDFRTEILGLMKAQVVKNAVIVPVGSKGGFVCKRLPDGPRDQVMEEVKECYRTLMRGLLDLTDNRKGATIVPPEQTVRHDEDDPYLVVAADKGTATFSDIANGISADYGFWLDDAFASGGSAGYDHKKMAITARGAWEAVKRHFRETGKDIQSEDFTVVGVGDMGGDVFGNGMLLSKHIQLVGAFNHIHIFIDPDPDPARSYKERKRLFEMPRSSWMDYDVGLISKGGGVFDRKAKSIPVSDEMRERFGLSETRVTPNELIRVLLRAEAELLWLGGIGTYVKATTETHLDADDRGNDALRIDASELRVQVIGEGANLGLTQRARIEFAVRGGRLNMDAIDNSAGVDCSDHEVNIKVLFGEAERRGDLDRAHRDERLVAMTDDVAGLVLRHNYLQTQAVTVTHQLGAHLVDRLGRYMRDLEKEGRLDRKLEFLPDDETLRDRVKEGKGFTRPELAILLSYSKIDLFQELMESNLPDDEAMDGDLAHYFPKAIRDDFRPFVLRHLLRREIIATVITNDIVNRLGISFVSEVKAKTGVEACDVARAYMVAREIHGLRDQWTRIEELDSKAPSSLQATLLTECGRILERTAGWMLSQHGTAIDPAGSIEMYGPGVKEVTDNLEELLPQGERKLFKDQAYLFVAQGAPADMSESIAKFGWLLPACDIVRVATDQGREVREVAEVYFAIGERFGLDWLRRAAGHLPRDTAWDKLAVSAVLDDIYGVQAQLAAQVIGDGASEAGAGVRLELWARNRMLAVTRTDELMGELRAVGNPDLAMLAVALRQLKSVSQTPV
ncbi:MAG: NAD-glutamate dehydrogenase [Planctomycetota bacterium]|jgi:glutamate dehydrogenase